MIIQYMNIDSLPDPEYHSDLLLKIGKYRENKILSYRKAEDRKLCFAAGLLLNEMMEKYHLREDDIVYNKNGKPECEGVFFNISHSGRYAVIASDERPIGIDIEKIDKKRVMTSILSSSEQQYVLRNGLPESFFRIWTLKEAYIKKCGETIEMWNHISVVDEEGKLDLHDGSLRWHSEILDGHVLTVVFEKDAVSGLETEEIIFK